ncbi:MAG: hypothetical protein KAS71_12410, partial [Bacteroidales bacterium]|nr:hypothetical protein [Bacteroidales bacterium]
MTNKTRTVLSCNDWRKFTETMQSISFKNSKIKLSERSAEIVSQNGYPEKEILKLSIENPNLIFKSQYSLFSEDYSIWHIFEYSQGQVKEIGLRPSYTVPNYNLNIESFMG